VTASKELMEALHEAQCRRLIKEISNDEGAPAWGTIVNAFLSQNKIVVGEDKVDAVDELREAAALRAKRRGNRFKDNPVNKSNVIKIASGTE